MKVEHVHRTIQWHSRQPNFRWLKISNPSLQLVIWGLL